MFHIDLKGIFKLTGMTHLSNMPCKDDSRYCTTISARSCTQPLQADVCKRTCGLCNNNPLPLPSQPIPPFPLPSTSKLLNKLFYLKTINGISVL